MNSMLDYLFAKFNSDDRPNGDKMHSLSVSDVVQIENHYFICRGFGWGRIKFEGEEIVKTR